MRMDTDTYRNRRNRMPRGYGMWIFEMTTSTGTETFTAIGMYSAARTQAMAAARNANATSVRVCE